MKTFLLGITCGIALAATTAGYASDTIHAYLFPVTYVLNGQSNTQTVKAQSNSLAVPKTWAVDIQHDSVRFSIEGKEIGGLEIEGYIEDKKLAYDLYFNQAYIDEQTMMNIAKSLKLNH